MEAKVKEKLDQLNKIKNLYSNLNRRTKHKYRFREEAILLQIEVLEELLAGEDNIPAEWMACYREDCWLEN